MRALIYCRVSTKEQVEQGLSLDNQEIEGKKFARQQGYEVDTVFIERGESAKTTSRTELQKMIKYALVNRKKIDAVIIWKLDRLARSLPDQIELIKYFDKLNVKVLSCTESNEETSIGKLMRNIIGSFAQFDNDVKSERTVSGMKQAIRQGRWVSVAPFGYKNDRQRSLVPVEQKAYFIRKAFEAYATGLYKQTDIVSMLRREGLSGINANNVNRMLRNHVYRGYISKPGWFDEPQRGIFEPLVDNDLFFKVQAILEGRKPQITGYKRNNADFPLRAFITCPDCNQPLTASWSKGRSKKYAYYHCVTKDCDIHFRVKKEEVEDAFVSLLSTIKPKENILEFFKAVVRDVYNAEVGEQLNAQKRLQNEITELKDKKSKLLDLFIDGKVEEVTYKDKDKVIEEELANKMAMLSDVKVSEESVLECIDFCCQWLSNIDTLWLDGDLDLRQRFQKLIFPQGLAYLKNGEFRTIKKSPVFDVFEGFSNDYNEVGRVRGFEPPHIGTTIRGLNRLATPATHSIFNWD